MKTRNITLLCVVALATLSFTFIGTRTEDAKKTSDQANTMHQSEPTGGFVSESIAK